MDRDYTDGTHDDVEFFIGNEIEKTAALGLKTLFVVGTHDADKVLKIFKESGCEHIYFGANQSFHPKTDKKWHEWDDMLFMCKEENILHTLDFDVSITNMVMESMWVESDIFIPMISVKLPYIEQLPYNACIKIDDTDFKASNPGVWVHHVHELMDRDKFTNWTQYKEDTPW